MFLKIFYIPIILFFIFQISGFAALNEISVDNEIRYEYLIFDPIGTSPLIICVPGFTQHNSSPEYIILKDYLLNAGYSLLIMNPPQHGEDFTWFKKQYTWGETEANDLLTLVTHLDIWSRHSEIHLLGFSIGAKIVLKFCALPQIGNRVASVIAVAPPYRVGDINAILTGDFSKVAEGLISSFNAVDRAGFLRLSYMTLGGIKTSFFMYKPSPADEITRITAPILLIHGSDDWLTRSYHSIKLFSQAEGKEKIAITLINTRTHAEDMLSRGSSKVKNAFLFILFSWLDYIKKDLDDKNNCFNDKFNEKIKTDSNYSQLIYPPKKVSLMTSPALNGSISNLWSSAADHNHSLITANILFDLNHRNNLIAKNFFTIGSTRFPQKSIIDHLRAGLSFEQHDWEKATNFEGYLSMYYSIGSLIRLRRLSYIFGLGNSFNRNIVSFDLAFLLLDFQLCYGRFSENKNSTLINFNFPMIANANGSYFFGICYSKFLSSGIKSVNQYNYSSYLVGGPSAPIFNTRMRFVIQCRQNKLTWRNQDRAWSWGISLNFREK